MKRVVAAFLVLTALGAPVSSEEKGGPRLDFTAMDLFWQIQGRLGRDLEVDDATWEALFATPAYRYITRLAWDEKEFRTYLRQAFMPSLAKERQATAARTDYTAIQFRHLLRVPGKKREIQALQKTLAEGTFFGRVTEMIRAYLPEGAMESVPEPPAIRFALFAPDSYAGTEEVYIDLLVALDLGDECEPFLAHELHHTYHAQISRLQVPSRESPHNRILHLLMQLQTEGIADLIDKKSFPIASSLPSRADYVEAFNGFYEEAPETLESIDVLLREVARDPGRAGELGERIWKLVHFGGHPEGFYMVNRTLETLGHAVLMEDLDNPFAFLRRYNEAAKRSGKGHVFSDEALDYLASLEARYVAEPRGR